MIEPSPASRLRRGLLVTASAIIAGTALELASTRHWDGAIQLIPWAALGVLVTSVVLVATARTPGILRTGRVLALVAGAASAIGVYEHIKENHSAGPLDFRYAVRWSSMSTVSQWWHAATKAVGPAPPLAPAVLAIASLCILYATVQHPAQTRSPSAEQELAPVGRSVSVSRRRR